MSHEAEEAVAPMPRRVDVLGVPVDALTVEELHRYLKRFIGRGDRATVLHANVHAINLASRRAHSRPAASPTHHLCRLDVGAGPLVPKRECVDVSARCLAWGGGRGGRSTRGTRPRTGHCRYAPRLLRHVT